MAEWIKNAECRDLSKFNDYKTKYTGIETSKISIRNLRASAHSKYADFRGAQNTLCGFISRSLQKLEYYERSEYSPQCFDSCEFGNVVDRVRNPLARQLGSIKNKLIDFNMSKDKNVLKQAKEMFSKVLKSYE